MESARDKAARRAERHHRLGTRKVHEHRCAQCGGSFWSVKATGVATCSTECRWRRRDAHVVHCEAPQPFHGDCVAQRHEHDQLRCGRRVRPPQRRWCSEKCGRRARANRDPVDYVREKAERDVRRARRTPRRDRSRGRIGRAVLA